MENKTFPPHEWFEKLFGFKEDVSKIYDNIECIEHDDAAVLRSKINGKEYKAGNFQVRTVSSFKNLLDQPRNGGKLHLIKGDSHLSKHFELIDVLQNQGLPENDGASYLAASNFNCLEFVSPYQTAHNGVTRYVYDGTQGPYCSLGSGPAIVYRNYFVKQPNGNVGQLETEIELLARTPFEVSHGYPLIYDTTAFESSNFDWSNPDNYPVGVHRNCQITTSQTKKGEFYLVEEGRIVHHIFAAAFNFVTTVRKNEFTLMVAKRLLSSEYRAAILAAWENSILFPGRPGSNKLYLTLLGGGVFRNPFDLICGAIEENMDVIKMSGLDVYVVCFSTSIFEEVNSFLGKCVEETDGSIIDAN
ncbi:uncharacterized protein GO595_005772 [Histomonas meleagridis]|uniref:uncharacterized protein n=1 Tax=Histomonas meleagridis TaxID=135588 RepID=UPI003559B1FE|nr:hypothetical protein GO595_005772 [Histomonas meleagridis]